MSDLVTCPGCGLALPPENGPTDPYGGASSACWARFGAVTARDYGEFRYPPVHRTLVDAYLAQHPGFATPAGRRSVVVHLVGLHLAIERGVASDAIASRLGAVFADKRDIAPLVPIPRQYNLTIDVMRAADTLEEHSRHGRSWAEAVWSAWHPHHEQVRAWAEANRTVWHRPQAR